VPTKTRKFAHAQQHSEVFVYAKLLTYPPSGRLDSLCAATSYHLTSHPPNLCFIIAPPCLAAAITNTTLDHERPLLVEELSNPSPLDGSCAVPVPSSTPNSSADSPLAEYWPASPPLLQVSPPRSLPTGSVRNTRVNNSHQLPPSSHSLRLLDRLGSNRGQRPGIDQSLRGFPPPLLSTFLSKTSRLRSYYWSLNTLVACSTPRIVVYTILRSSNDQFSSHPCGAGGFPLT
jgi:hypothetical protein